MSGFAYKPSLAGQSKKKHDPLLYLTSSVTPNGAGSGLLVLLDMLVLHEIHFCIPISVSTSESSSQVELQRSLRRAFDRLFKCDKSYDIACKAAYSVSPLLALAFKKRCDQLKHCSRNPQCLSVFGRLLVERPSVLWNTSCSHWQFVPELLSVYSDANSISNNSSERLKDLMFANSAPPYAVIAMLNRCDEERKEKKLPVQSQWHIAPAVVR